MDPIELDDTVRYKLSFLKGIGNGEDFFGDEEGFFFMEDYEKAMKRYIPETRTSKVAEYNDFYDMYSNGQFDKVYVKTLYTVLKNAYKTFNPRKLSLSQIVSELEKIANKIADEYSSLVKRFYNALSYKQAKFSKMSTPYSPSLQANYRIQ